MPILYPRLLANTSAAMFEEYRRRPVVELRDVVSLRHDSAVFLATGGDRVAVDRLAAIRESVLEAAVASGFPEGPSATEASTFDRRVAIALHQEMGLVPAEAGARDVWAFLALCVVPDVAFWRYPAPPTDRVLGTDLTRHVLARLWWRAHLVHDPEAVEPYEAIDVLGEGAFDQIYARRESLGGSQEIVQGIIAVWRVRAEGPDWGVVQEREALREFLKRLLRLGAFVNFESLDRFTLRAELEIVLGEALAALGAEAGV